MNKNPWLDKILCRSTTPSFMETCEKRRGVTNLETWKQSLTKCYHLLSPWFKQQI